MKQRDYVKCEDITSLSLDSLYEGSSKAIEALKENIIAIIETEAPVTLNTIKKRLRESFGVAKISSKALEIIFDLIKECGFNYTKEIYDLVYWPSEGVFKPDYFRVNSEREIYDVPASELKIMLDSFNENGLDNEELYYAVLNEFGHKSLTQKALIYLEYVRHFK